MPETINTQGRTPVAEQRRTLADLLALRSTWTIGFTALTVALIAFLVVGALMFPSPKGKGYAGSAAIMLTSISMVSPQEGWASGDISGAPATILMHYQGGHWTIVPKPSGLAQNARVTQVDMLSATDGWALSTVDIPIHDGQGSTTPGGMILHYDGTAWSVAVPQTRAPLLHLSVDSAQDGWAVGQSGLLLRYDGHAWSEVHDSSFAALGNVTQIAALSPQDAWAGSDNGLAHFDGTRWNRVAIHDPAFLGNAQVTALAMTSDREGWAIAGSQLLHDDGGTWRVVNSPHSPAPTVLAVPEPGAVWLVGYPNNLLMAYTNGKWTSSTPPVTETLAAMTFVSPTEGWAVGAHGTLLHYIGGSWRRVTDVTWDKAAYAAWAGQ